ncbi:MAG: hypothetical protein WC786_06480 [Patescibacteria group bacterium]
MLYYGALRERSLWRDRLGAEAFQEHLKHLPPLDEINSVGGLGDPTPEDWERLGKVEIVIINISRMSLVGLARELLVKNALDLNADYLFCWDSDMSFRHDTFLRLWRHDKPVVGALAFTSREPVYPVITRTFKRWDRVNGMVMVGSEPVYDYPKDQLVGNAEVSGELAIGGGVVLYNMDVFKKVPQPWFYSTGTGEDWYFSTRCAEHGVPRFIDTSVKTRHRLHAPAWSDEEYYWDSRKNRHSEYVALAKRFGITVRDLSVPEGGAA